MSAPRNVHGKLWVARTMTALRFDAVEQAGGIGGPKLIQNLANCP